MRTLGFVGKLATLAVAIGVAVGAETARAETRTWTGDAGDGLWSSALNWTPEGAPAAGDDITVAASSPHATPGTIRWNYAKPDGSLLLFK